jgi:hypothetical protein
MICLIERPKSQPKLIIAEEVYEMHDGMLSKEYPLPTLTGASVDEVYNYDFPVA